MKHITKILSIVLCIALMAVGFTACSSSKEETKTTETKTYKIGIIQYMSHPSLDNCYNGIKQGLDESGIKYELDYQTGAAATADADCSNFAKNMVSQNCDMIFAIATPAAEAAYSATADTEIPVIFCAVSDPVAAKLVTSLEEPGDICTGTRDQLNLSSQVDLIQAMQPDVKNIGILYTASEKNSISNLKEFTKICKERSITVTPSAVNNSADIPAAADTLASKVDCINNFTDNNVVNNLSVLLSAADKYGIPVYGSEEEQVKNGCLASISIDYIKLGAQTGEMGAKVLGGDDASKMSVITVSDTTPVVNKDTLSSLKMDMPEKYSDATIVTSATTTKAK